MPIYKTCLSCGKDFAAKSTYYLHKKTCKSSDDERKETRTPSRVCECGLECGSLSTYYRHKKSCENNSCRIKFRQEHFTCREDVCSFTSFHRAEFLKHLQAAHLLQCNKEEKIFLNYSEFEEWKENFEKLTKASFTLKYTRKRTSETIKYFICNRSGCFTSKNTGKRRMKSQGLNKIGFNCPASITVRIKDLNIVNATIYPLHYGHDNKLFHLRLSKTDRKSISSQLFLGIDRSHVLQNIFSMFPDDLERKHLTTRQDLRNISRAYGINKIEKNDAEDHISVDAYVEENLQNEKSIFLYKKQNECVLQNPKDEHCPLDTEDFALAIMTDFQCKMLKKFGHNIVCIDAIHGTNCCDFKLITVLVIDEFKEGIPVAWLLSNRETCTSLKLFFTLIKKQTGNISTKIIMSDKAPHFYNAWNDTFQGHPKKLLCHWRVLHDWQKNLNKIKDKNMASTLFMELSVLLQETEEDIFNELLEKCLHEMHENEFTQEFASYFESQWVNLKEEWAKCFRIGSEINTDIYVESFYKSLKYGGYLNVKQNRKISKCLYFLLKFSRDLFVNRLLRLEKEKSACKVTAISSSHRKSLELSLSLARRISSDSWEVLSEKSILSASTSADNLVYHVAKQPECNKNCLIKCQYCNICIHSYTCSCPDFMLNTNICQHIHLVVRGLDHENSTNDHKKVNHTDDDNTSEVFSYFDEDYVFEQPPSESGSSLSDLKSTLAEKTTALFELIEMCNDKDSLLTAIKHVDSTYSVLQLKNNRQELLDEKKDSVCTNLNATKQQMGLSRKRKNPNTKLDKLTYNEKIDLEQNILPDEFKGKHIEHSYFKELPKLSEENS